MVYRLRAERVCVAVAIDATIFLKKLTLFLSFFYCSFLSWPSICTRTEQCHLLPSPPCPIMWVRSKNVLSFRPTAVGQRVSSTGWHFLPSESEVTWVWRALPKIALRTPWLKLFKMSGLGPDPVPVSGGWAHSVFLTFPPGSKIKWSSLHVRSLRKRLVLCKIPSWVRI